MSNRLESLWAELAAIVGTGPSAFAPVADAELAALHAHYRIPAWFEKLMRAGYPARGLRVFGTEWFSSPEVLIEYIAGSSGAARWFPVEICEGHRIHVVSDVDGALAQVEMESNDALDGPDEPSRFGSLERVLGWLCVLVPLAHAHCTREAGAPLLTRAGESALVRALGPEGAEDVCELFHIERIALVRTSLERAVRRSDQLALAMTAATIVAGAGAFTLPRGPWIPVLGILAVCALMVGAGAWLGGTSEKRRLRAVVSADAPPADDLPA
jgi:hypothetical protein